MALNYKKELESAAKNMIMVHDPDLLIRMIVRTIVQKVRVTHAGILLQDPASSSYIVQVSRGARGVKIPAGFARMGSANALIRFLCEPKYRPLLPHGAVLTDELLALLKRRLGPEIKELLRGVLRQMDIFQIVACIPAYYRDDLLGVLLLGHKRNGRVFYRDELDFFVALTSDVTMAIRNAHLFGELRKELQRRQQLFTSTIFALAAAIDAKDHYTHGHTGRVRDLSLRIAAKLTEKQPGLMGQGFRETLETASLLHDIGKIGVPEAILNKQGPLSDAERALMQEHPRIGTRILERIDELSESMKGVLCHHEWYDGSGYPQGLKEAQIPLVAAIIAVADSFDAMTTDRPYRRGFSTEEALREIRAKSGTQFSPAVAAACLSLFEKEQR